MAHKPIGVCRAAIGTLGGIPGAQRLDALDRNISHRVTRGIELADLCLCDARTLHQVHPGVDDVAWQLALRRLQVEWRTLIDRVLGDSTVHAAILLRGLIDQQVIAIEGALDGAYGLASNHELFGRTVQIRFGRLIQVVQPRGVPDHPFGAMP